jgi:hypothetical protein
MQRHQTKTHRDCHPVSNRLVVSNVPRSGFLLVMVLFCLLIAGLTLVSLSQRSIVLTTEAAIRTDCLQNKWAVQSLQQTFLPRVGDLFKARDEHLADSEAALPYSSTISVGVEMSGRTVQLVLADEGARLNLNLIHTLGPTKTNRLLRRVCGNRLQAAIRLRPLVMKKTTQQEQEQEQEIIPQVFGSWAQVFDLSAIPPVEGALPVLFDNITCWGPGRLNVMRADRETAIQFCSELTSSSSSARRILEAWWEDPRLSLPRVIESKGGLSAEEVEQLQQLLVDRSSSYSTTVLCRSPHSTTTRFAVIETDDEGTLRSVEFNY